MSIKQFITLLSVFILSHFSLSATDVIIIESQSFNAMQRMDENWATVLNNMGYTNAIYGEDNLPDDHILEAARLLIVSSGLAEISNDLRDFVFDFATNGGNVYIQSEYQINNPGNVLFDYCVNNMDGQFSWTGEALGDLVPMEITGSIDNNVNPMPATDYFWFGAYGSGDETIQPVMHYEGNAFGFIYNPSTPGFGKIFTCSDQDWIRTFQSPELMENILFALLEVATVPNITIASSNEEPCVEEAVTFTATLDSHTENFIIEWYINGILAESSPSLNFTIEQPESGMIIHANVIVDEGQNTSNEVELIILQPLSQPALSISSDFISICEAEMVTFTANHSGTEFAGNVAFQWMINGFAVLAANEENFSSNNFQDGDVINCHLSYDDICTENNLVQSNEIEIEVNSITTPEVIINADVLAICAGATVNFSATGTHWGDNPVFQWTVEGEPVGDNQPTFSSNAIQAGQLVACQVSSSNVCISAPSITSADLSIQVIENVTPTLELSADQLSVCSGEPVQIFATGANWGDEPVFQWILDGAFIENNSDVLTLTVPSDGQTVELALTSSLNCSDQAQVYAAPIHVQVAESFSPVISVAADQETPCFGSSVTFSAIGENWGDSPEFQWVLDGVPVQGNQMEFTLLDIQEAHQVQCKVIADLNCSENVEITSEIFVVETTGFSLDLVEAKDADCGETNGIIIVEANGGVLPINYEWSNGDSGNKIENLSGNTYELLATDATGCTQELSVTISGGDAPLILGVETADTECGSKNGWAEAIVANESENISYKWRYQNGEIVSEAAVAENLEEGLYELIVTKGGGCVSSQTVTIFADASNWSVQINHDSVRINAGEKHGLVTTNNLGSEAIYQWAPSEGLSCTDCMHPTAKPLKTTTYVVLVSTPDGCMVQDSVTIYVDARQDIYVPNVFSPNNDGKNDYFMAFGEATAGNIKSMTVFDRSGGIVFDKKDIPLNNESEGWDGTSRGKKVAPGVYIYIVNIEFSDGTSQSYQGDVSLL